VGVLNATQEAASDLLTKAASAGASRARRLGITELVVFEATKTQLDAILQSGDVEGVQIDEAVPPTLNTAVPVIHGGDAHSRGARGVGQYVAILDTGVDRNHAFFGGRVIEEACFSSNTAQSTSVCPNQSDTQVGPGSAAPCALVISGCDHGTHVAGIAAGFGNSLTGVAPLAGIVAIQVFSRFPSGHANCTNPNGCALSYTSDQIEALSYVQNSLANRLPIVAINMSLGAGNHQACPGNYMAPVISALRSIGIATVISAGNDALAGGVGSPGCIPDAITVGASNDNDTIAQYSNSSDVIDLLAPGSDLVSAVPGGQFAPKSGTSMAAPIVAGAIAAVQSYFTTDLATTERQFATSGPSIVTLVPSIRKTRIDLFSAWQQRYSMVARPDTSLTL